jgi:hypothetical protein
MANFIAVKIASSIIISCFAHATCVFCSLQRNGSAQPQMTVKLTHRDLVFSDKGRKTPSTDVAKNASPAQAHLLPMIREGSADTDDGNVGAVLRARFSTGVSRDRP